MFITAAAIAQFFTAAYTTNYRNSGNTNCFKDFFVIHNRSFVKKIYAKLL
jgi:hypothetical protein